MSADGSAESPNPALFWGTWTVEPTASELTFEVKHNWGLGKVHGRFDSFRGGLTADEDGARGELTIDSTSLDTGNEKRDVHLRSADFFDVGRYSEFSFEATAIEPADDGGLLVSGTLGLPRADVSLRLPVEVSGGEGGRLRIKGEATVGRAEAGMHWNRLGTIRGDVSLRADLEIVREERPAR